MFIYTVHVLLPFSEEMFFCLPVQLLTSLLTVVIFVHCVSFYVFILEVFFSTSLVLCTLAITSWVRSCNMFYSLS